MKKKSCLSRIFSLAVILTVLFISFCPAVYAAPVYLDTSFCVNPTEVNFSSFALKTGSLGEYYTTQVALSSNMEIFENSSSVMVWFDDYSFTTKSFQSDVSSVLFLGNRLLLNAGADDTGENYFVGINPSYLNQVTLVFSADFYNTLIASGETSLTFAIQPIDEPDIVGSVSAGLNNSVHWVGQVVNAFISPDGAFSGLLSMFAILIVIPALILGFKIIRSFVWGA